MKGFPKPNASGACPASAEGFAMMHRYKVKLGTKILKGIHAQGNEKLFEKAQTICKGILYYKAKKTLRR